MPAVSPEILKQVKGIELRTRGLVGLALRRRVPLGVPGAGDGVRRGARLRAGRRLPLDRLERLRPAGQPLRQDVHRRARADAHAARRPVRLDPVRRAAHQGLARGRGGRRARARGGPPERPGRRAPVRRRGRARDSSAEGPAPRAPGHSRPRRVRAARAGAPIWPRASRTRAGCSATGASSWCCPTSSPKAGSSRSAGWRRGTRSSRSRWTILASTTCPSPAGSRCRTPNPAGACWSIPEAGTSAPASRELSRARREERSRALAAAGADQVAPRDRRAVRLPAPAGVRARAPPDQPRMSCSASRRRPRPRWATRSGSRRTVAVPAGAHAPARRLGRAGADRAAGRAGGDGARRLGRGGVSDRRLARGAAHRGHPGSAGPPGRRADRLVAAALGEPQDRERPAGRAPGLRPRPAAARRLRAPDERHADSAARAARRRRAAARAAPLVVAAARPSAGAPRAPGAGAGQGAARPLGGRGRDARGRVGGHGASPRADRCPDARGARRARHRVLAARPSPPAPTGRSPSWATCCARSTRPGSATPRFRTRSASRAGSRSSGRGCVREAA